MMDKSAHPVRGTKAAHIKRGTVKMKHLKSITVARAEHSSQELGAILNSVFNFVIAVIQYKGKGQTPNV